MLPLAVLLPVADLTVNAIQVEGHSIQLTATSTQPAAGCPLCQTQSVRVHSRYTRTVADVPCFGRSLVVALHVRRFFCDARHCPRKIFAERFGDAVPTFARRTARLLDTLRTLAFAAGGHGGARIAHALAMPTSVRTLLRLMHAQSLPLPSTPRVVGIDDWAWKKGRNYGTLIVDLDRHQPLDLLPDRVPDTVAAWLAAHPTIEVIARDRSAGYTDAATRGAPQATQVADRWHLVHNLGATLERFFLHKRSLLKQAAHAFTNQTRTATTARPAPHAIGLGRTRADETASLRQHTAALERYHTIHNLHAKRVDVANIARQVGVSRRTVYRQLQMSEPPPRKQPVVHRLRRIDPYIPYLVQRWNEGCRSARQLWREIAAHGYRYGESSVQRYIRHLRWETGSPYKFRRAAPAQHYTPTVAQQRPLTPLQVSRLCLTRPEQRQPWQTAYLDYLRELDETIACTYAQVEAFLNMVRQREGTQFDQWLAEVATTAVPEMRAFATSLRKDYAAVKAGLTLPYSNGQTEAQIQRLKLVKRAMYGKAGFNLLRQRVLHRQPAVPSKPHASKVPQRLTA